MTAEKSRIPLPVNAALERMNLPSVGDLDAAATMPVSPVPGRLLTDYVPLSESIEWKVAQAHWDSAGLLPFVESEVPFLVNNNGRLSADVARVLYAHCMEAEPLPAALAMLEIGAGTGLFARYFLDAFRALCEEGGKDFYSRLTYVVTDRSARTVTQWEERGLFDAHRERVSAATYDPTDSDGLPPYAGSLRAVICNYVLDVLPSTVVRAGAAGPEELQVRTYLTADPALLAQYTTRSADELAALAASARAEDLLQLAPCMSLLELATAFRPIGNGSVPYLDEALEFGAGAAPVLLNHGAIRAIERFVGAMDEEGLILVSDYGASRKEQVAGFCSLQRFGPSVAFGIDFPLLEQQCARRRIATTAADGDEQRGIQTRLLSRGALPRTRAEFQDVFAARAQAFFEAPVEAARAHAGAGRLHEALDGYREALTRSPRSWSLIGEAGEFLSVHLRSYDAAVELLRTAVALNPCYSPWLWNALGDALYCQERYEDAHEAYLQAARIDPEDVRTNLNLSYTHAHFGRPQDALEAIAHGLARDSREIYGSRLLERQRQILAQLSASRQAEDERLRRRAARFLAA